MKAFIILCIIVLCTRFCLAQRIVFDRRHFGIVNENGAIRTAAENTHHSYLNNIKNRISDINMNLSSVVMVQSIIYNSLTQVDQALRSGLAIRQIGQISQDIIYESNILLQITKDQPYLLLFAEDVSKHLKNRGIRLVSEVSTFILREGEQILMDFEKRDALLRKIILELRVIRTLVYSMHRSMYWAKFNGVFKSINPYKDFINQDIRLVNDILYKYNLIKK